MKGNTPRDLNSLNCNSQIGAIELMRLESEMGTVLNKGI